MSGLAAFRQSLKVDEPQNAYVETMAEIPDENIKNADEKKNQDRDLNHRSSVVYPALRKNNHQEEQMGPQPRNSRQALSVGRSGGIKGGNKPGEFSKKKEGRQRRGRDFSADSRSPTPISFTDNLMA